MKGRGWSRRQTLMLTATATAAAALPGVLTSQALGQGTNDAERIDALVDSFMRAFGTPGIGLALVRPGRPVFTRGYGVRRLGGPEKLDADTLFAIGSNSKGMVAAGLAILVEAGKLAWDEPVQRYLPDFATSDPVVTRLMTVRDLLCHRSGLALGAGDLMQFPLTDHRTRTDIYHGLRYLPFEHGFRSGFAYDNILYVVAGVLIERVSNMTFEEYMTTRLLRPLGMRTAVASRDLIRTANVAGRHARLGPPTRGIGPLSVVQPDEPASPAGSINASLTNISLWLQTQLAGGMTPAGQRLWSQDSATEMWTPQVITASSTGPTDDHPIRGVLQAYALGWFVGDYRSHRIVFHSGGLSGQITQVAMLPEQGIGVAVFTNVEDNFSDLLRNAILDELISAPRVDWLAKAQRYRLEDEEAVRKSGSGDYTPPPGGPSLPIAAYAGLYRDPWYGDIVVRDGGGKLTIDFTHTVAFKSALEPFGPDTFRTRFPPGAGEDAVVAFLIEDGKPMRLKLRALSPLADFSYDFQHLAPARVH